MKPGDVVKMNHPDDDTIVLVRIEKKVEGKLALAYREPCWWVTPLDGGGRWLTLESELENTDGT